METDKTSAIRALGLGLIFVGITIVFGAGILFLLSVFLPEDIVSQMPSRGFSMEINPVHQIINMMPVWAFMLMYGLMYTFVALKVRDLELWAYRVIIGMSALLPVLVCACGLSILSTVSQANLTLFALPSTLGVGAPAAALIWYMSKKEIRVHFT